MILISFWSLNSVDQMAPSLIISISHMLTMAAQAALTIPYAAPARSEEAEDIILAVKCQLKRGAGGLTDPILDIPHWT